MGRSRRSSFLWCLLLIMVATIPAAAFQIPSNGPVTYLYDELGRLTGVIDAAGNAATYSYDAVGNILSIQRYSPSQVSVLSFTPGQGASGDSVTIYGTGFSATAGQNTVQFNGVPATVTSATQTQLVVSVPSGAATGLISVTSPLGTAASANSFTVRSGNGSPTITAINPVVGTAGAAITITGTNFDGATNNNVIRFNGTVSGAGTASTTSLSTSIPTGATSGHVSVSTPTGTAISSTDLFVPFGTHTVADVGFTGRITIGGSTSFTLSTPGRIGLVVLDGNPGQRIGIQWDSSIASCALYLFAPNGTQLTSASCATGSSGIDNIFLPATGTYTIGIENPTGTGSLGLQITDVSDVSGTVVIDGPPVAIATTKAGQDARLYFSAVAGQRVVVQTTNVTNPSTFVELLDATGEVMTNQFIAAGSSFFLDTQNLLATGRYTLWILHNGTNVGGATFQVTSVPLDLNIPIAIGGSPVRVPTAGNTAMGQNVSLTFSAAAGQKVSISVTNSTYPYSKCFLNMKDPAGNGVASGACDSASSFVDTRTLTTAGTYTILVDPQDTSTGTATLKLNDDADMLATIAIDGAPVTVSPIAGQDARLTFTASAGQRVFLQVTGVSNPSATVYMLKPDGTTQALVGISNNPGIPAFFIDTQTLATAGTYTIWVQHVGGNVGSETLKLTGVPADFTAAISIGGAAVRVPSSGDTAIGQNAVLSVTATAGQKFSVNTSNNTFGSATGCNLVVRDPLNNAIASASCGVGASSPTFVTANTAGTYSILIDPQGTAVGTTTIALGSNNDIIGSIAIDGPAVTATTTVAGQDVRLNFPATTGQRVFLKITAVSNPSATVYLLKPDGSAQAGVSISNNPGIPVFFIDTRTLASAGTYSLWVQHSGTSFGSETLQLTSVANDFTAPITMGGPAVRVPATGDTTLGQNGVLTFSATAGQRVSMSLSNSTYAQSAGCTVTLKDPNGSGLSGGSCYSNAYPFVEPVTLAATGAYTILVDPTGTATGTTTVALNDSSDFTASIVAGGLPVTVPTTNPGQDARLTFSATAGQRVALQISSVTNPAATVFLVKPDGSVQTSLAINNNAAQQPFFIDTLTLATTGSYTWWIRHSGANTGSEVLQLFSVPADFTATITAGGSAVRVPTSGDTAVGQNATLTFAATSGTLATFTFSNDTFTPSTSAFCQFKDPSGGAVASVYCGAGVAPVSILPSVTGNYTLFINPQGNVTGNMTVSLQ